MFSLRIPLLAAAMAAVAVPSAIGQGWPADYQGVMLQGFSWDSYSDTRWTVLEKNAPEYSAYFNLIWVPNSAKSTGGMGYIPIYWFTNHNSAFGSEEELRSMIAAYRAKGTGIIADVVVNHRGGVSSWTDFPAETWDGQSWKIGTDGICSTDEVANASGQPKPTGAPDTGDDFDGARDLDHTNANVRENVKNYCRCLLEDFGYTGFRYDLVKGYAPEYTKIYNQYAKPAFSVGEYWDGSYDKCAAWIEGTGRESAAFDFPLKYQLNKAWSTGDLAELVWKANGTTDQPAGLIHYGYPRYAVTFVDNHDTYRDGSKFTGDVPAANAFILCSPGTPCVFLPHYKLHKGRIQQLVNIRRSVGVSNTSAVKVLRTGKNIYMAEVTGSNGTLVVRVGTATDTPAGYTDADVVAYGDQYRVWTKVPVTGEVTAPLDTPEEPGADLPGAMYIIGNLPQGHWATDKAVEMYREENRFAVNATIEPASASAKEGYFSFITATGSNWDSVNGSDRYGAASKDAPLTPGVPAKLVKFAANQNASSAYSWKIAPGTYSFTVDLGAMTVTAGDPAGITTPATDAAETPTVYYNLQGVRVDNPAPGLYIAVSGTKVTKVRLN